MNLESCGSELRGFCLGQTHLRLFPQAGAWDSDRTTLLQLSAPSSPLPAGSHAQNPTGTSSGRVAGGEHCTSRSLTVPRCGATLEDRPAVGGCSDVASRCRGRLAECGVSP